MIKMHLQKHTKVAKELIKKARKLQFDNILYKCKICGNEFQPTTPRHYFCSEKCKIENRKIWNKEKYKNLSETDRLKRQNARMERRQIQRTKLRNHIIKLKEESKCVICGESDFRCLQFHHNDRNKKESNITEFVKMGCSIEKLQKEINKCKILCANCHSKLHYNTRGLQNDKI